MFRRLFSVAVVALGSLLVGQTPPAEGALARARPQQEGAAEELANNVPSCIKVTLSAPYRGSGYDHTVTLESSCTAAAECNVKSTDPTPTHATVPPGKTVELLIWRGSPAYEFQADVDCKLP